MGRYARLSVTDGRVARWTSCGISGASGEGTRLAERPDIASPVTGHRCTPA
ncbi:hypothetical protein J6590_077403 [Homalodisca vitripennis]|nr:hypothetical protein J6590_077403 [Homalodisca vitripennis]